MYAVNRLRTFQEPSTRHIFDEVEVNKALNRINRGNDDTDVGTRAQSSPRAATSPGMSIVFHYVFIITKVVQVQQAIYRDIQYLHETSKLHDRCDEAVERLPNALTQVRTLEERRDIAVGLVSALLQL